MQTQAKLSTISPRSPTCNCNECPAAAGAREPAPASLPVALPVSTAALLESINLALSNFHSLKTSQLCISKTIKCQCSIYSSELNLKIVILGKYNYKFEKIYANAVQCWVIGKLKKKINRRTAKLEMAKKKKIRTENDTRATSLSPEQTHGKMPSIVSLHLAQLKQGVERASEQCSGDHNQWV